MLIKTINFTATVNYTIEKGFTTDSQIISQSSEELFTIDSQTISQSSEELFTMDSQIFSQNSEELFTMDSQTISQSSEELFTMDSQIFSQNSEELFTMDSQTISPSFEEVSYSSSEGGLWTTATMVELSPIVTNSLLEQAITAGLLILFWIYVTFSNMSLFYVIRTEKSLHTAQYMVLVSYMVCDTLYCNFTLLYMVPVVISNNIEVISETVSRIMATVQISFLLASFHLIGLQAYERYCYFISPLQYIIKFTKLRFYTAVILTFVLAFCCTLAVDFLTPRVPVATFMTYQATGWSSRLSNYIYFVVYVLPSGAVSIVTLVKLRLLISKHNARVEPQSDVMNEDQSAVGGIIVKPIKKALKMICLVSGSFWLTVIPSMLIRAGVRGSGVTWADTDHRMSLPMFALARTSYLMMTVISSVLNPIIYISVLTELREAVWKCIRFKRNNSLTTERFDSP